MKKTLISFLAMAALFSCTVKEDEMAAPVAAELTEAEESCLVSGTLNVKFTEDMIADIEGDLTKGNFRSTKSSAINGAFDNLNVISVERLYPDAGEWEPRHREAGLHRWYLVKYDGKVSGTKAGADLALVDGIEFSEPVRKAKPTAVFNDPYLSKQWHYINSGGEKGLSKGCDINVEKVWTDYTCGSSEVIVSVVDQGIDLEHEDLKAACIAGSKTGSWNFVDNNATIVGEDHGTHVAGTIGAINNNGKGVCGIAGGSDGKGGVKLMSCQVFEGDKSATNFGAAIIWGADHGAVISQNSWGHVYETKEEAAKGSAAAVKDAIEYFIKYAGTDKNGNQTGPMKGGIVIFAAGNDGWPDGWPAEYSATQPLCISVGAVASNFVRAYYSNYGDWVTICAPGGDADVGYQIESTFAGNKYGEYQGTSMACPHVSGVAALIVSKYGGNGFTNTMLRERLVGGASKTKISSTYKIGPMLDALGSMTYGDSNPPEAVSDYTLEGRSNNLDFGWKVTSDPESKKAYGYLLVASVNESSIKNLNPKKLGSDVVSATIEVGEKAKGDDISGTVSGLEFNTKYYTAIFGYDYSGNWSKSSPVKSASTTGNNPPVIETDYKGDYVIKAHETLQVIYRIYDPDGHKITVEFTPDRENDPAATSELLPDGTYRVTYVGKKYPEGAVCNVKYKATDSYGLSTEYPITFTVLKNNPPVAKKQFEDMIFFDTGVKKSINMNEYITDPDGEQLTYKVSTTPLGIVTLNQVDSVLNMTTLDYGQAQVTIKATDACGAYSDFTFKVLVRDPAADPDIYPNPVKTILKVSDGAAKNLSVTLTSSFGVVLLTKEGEASFSKPLEIDMTSFAPGRYGIKVVSEDKTTTRIVVKI